MFPNPIGGNMKTFTLAIMALLSVGSINAQAEKQTCDHSSLAMEASAEAPVLVSEATESMPSENRKAASSLKRLMYLDPPRARLD